MKRNCVYNRICGGDTCARCDGYTTKTDIKQALKAIEKEPETVGNQLLIYHYKELLKGAKK